MRKRTWPIISTAISGKKDFSRSQSVRYTVNISKIVQNRDIITTEY